MQFTPYVHAICLYNGGKLKKKNLSNTVVELSFVWDQYNHCFTLLIINIILFERKTYFVTVQIPLLCSTVIHHLSYLLNSQQALHSASSG